jgi:hypothetical protein
VPHAVDLEGINPHWHGLLVLLVGWQPASCTKGGGGGLDKRSGSSDAWLGDWPRVAPKPKLSTLQLNPRTNDTR